MKGVETIRYYFPELVISIKQTGTMLGISLGFCLIVGLPLGIWLFLVNPKIAQRQTPIYWGLNFLITLVRSYPYLLLVITMIPFTRWLLGFAFGPFPASVPLSVVAIAIYARLVEQVLLDIPEEIRLLADSLGTSTWQYIYHFLLVEGRSGLVLAFTTTTVSMVSYSTVMGIVGGGGIGDFAIRYGYQRYEDSIMFVAIVFMVIVVFMVQMIGNLIAQKIDKRK